MGSAMTEDRLAVQPARAAGVLLIATAIASVVLLAIHPAETATDFAGILKDEAANQALDAAVHGGFIVVLALELIGLAAFSRRLDFARLSALAGLVFFAAGAAFLTGSVFTDGLIIPAIAAKYAATPAKLEYARSLFVLCGAAIRYLMPMGILFQSAGVASWGWALLRSGISRGAGIMGLLIGGAIIAALAATVAALNPIVVMGGIGAQALWVAGAGVLLIRRKL
jgi:hypothetical protein